MISEILIVTKNADNVPVNTTILRLLSRRRAKKVLEATNKVNDTATGFTVQAFPLWLDHGQHD